MSLSAEQLRRKRFAAARRYLAVHIAKDNKPPFKYDYTAFLLWHNPLKPGRGATESEIDINNYRRYIERLSFARYGYDRDWLKRMVAIRFYRSLADQGGRGRLVKRIRLY
jgi:hypothetical protein